MYLIWKGNLLGITFIFGTTGSLIKPLRSRPAHIAGTSFHQTQMLHDIAATNVHGPVLPDRVPPMPLSSLFLVVGHHDAFQLQWRPKSKSFPQNIHSGIYHFVRSGSEISPSLSDRSNSRPTLLESQPNNEGGYPQLIHAGQT